MGKGDRPENYYVKDGEEWIPIDIGRSKGGLKGQKSAKNSRSSSEEYYVQRDGKWVKVSGGKTAVDMMFNMQISSSESSVPPVTVIQAPMEQYQTPMLVAAAPQGPLEYHEYIITVKPPSDPAPGAVEPLPVPAGPRRIPRQPIERAPPNEYADGPIVAERAPVYRESPPAGGMRRRPRGPRYVSPRRNYTPPPHPIPEPPVIHYREKVDAYEMGREAYHRENAGGVDYVDDSCGCDDDQGLGARTSAAPGYYLAGYIYYGDPTQPTPKLEPVTSSGAVQCPPGHYLAGYTTGDSAQQSTTQAYPVPGYAVQGYPTGYTG